MYFNINFFNDKYPDISAEHLNYIQKQFEEMVEQMKKKKKDATLPFVIRKDINPNFVKKGEIFYLSSEDSQQLLSQTIGKTFYTFLQDPNGRLRYNNGGVEFRYKMVDAETAKYMMTSGSEQEEDPGGHGTPGEIGDNPYQPSKQTYTIYYYTVGGTTIDNQTVAGGTLITAPAGITTKDGYTFSGWFFDSEYGKEVVFPFSVLNNIVLYAKWTEEVPEQHTVHFVVNGGTTIEDMVVNDKVYIEEPTTTKDGYKIEGWYLDADFTDRIVFPYCITEDTTFYVKWEDATVYKTITYIYGTNEYSTKKVPVGSVVDLETPTKDGYNFDGWYLENTYKNQVNSPYTITDNIVLYAKWTEKIYYVVSFITSGTAVNSITVEQGESIAVIPTTYKEKYNFIGWYTDEAYTNKITFPFTPTQDITLYAKFELQQGGIKTYVDLSALKIKYIRDVQWGNTNNKWGNWTEMKVIKNGINIAQGCDIIISWDNKTISNSKYTDGDTSNFYSPYTGVITINTYYIDNNVMVILNEPSTIDSIIVYRTNGTAQFYHRIEVSENGTDWIIVDNSDIDGTYTETENGKTIDFANKQVEICDYTNLNVKYIRDVQWGNRANTYGNWGEMQAIKGNDNVALGCDIITSWNNKTISNSTYTDGVINNNIYYDVDTRGQEQNVMVILNQPTNLDKITLWRYNNSRFYCKVQISEDGTDWITVEDTNLIGTYSHENNGRTISLITRRIVNKETN